MHLTGMIYSFPRTKSGNGIVYPSVRVRSQGITQQVSVMAAAKTRTWLTVLSLEFSEAGMKVHEEAVLNGGVRSDLLFLFSRLAELDNLAPDVLVRRP